ncbi:NAD(P)-dependent oxidoreductase [Tropicimonas sp. IMCC34043]|uniref:NAD-dependent epimerase/dehydratase family protein n=1 Tax=Tropicimonas sp. IMCC34043 TaxID=2248760 RepID=UPI000E275233|nr:NAD(P)-dependent oxidoreductase [Tropicimonas sp. IMCC34043]
MRIAVTGGTGLVGRFVVEAALAAGDEVVVLGRTAPPENFFSRPVRFLAHDLRAQAPALDKFEALVHAAFSHLPGRYRGGEGGNPEGFLADNLEGSLRLFRAAKAAGVRRAVFLSSRAVYGAYPPGTALNEATEPRPDTLYGEVKLRAERSLAALCGPGFATVSLRATGVYGPAGPGQRHKWQDLFEAFARGEAIAPRVATEVHGADLAAAVRLALHADPAAVSGQVFNVSDILLDRRDLLGEVARLTGTSAPLPPRADATKVNAMECDRLLALGWRPGGMDRLRDSLPGMLGQP